MTTVFAGRLVLKTMLDVLKAILVWAEYLFIFSSFADGQYILSVVPARCRCVPSGERNK